MKMFTKTNLEKHIGYSLNTIKQISDINIYTIGTILKKYLTRIFEKRTQGQDFENKYKTP